MLYFETTEISWTFWEVALYGFKPWSMGKTNKKQIESSEI